jgi:hypothetical protein
MNFPKSNDPKRADLIQAGAQKFAALVKAAAGKKS